MLSNPAPDFCARASGVPCCITGADDVRVFRCNDVRCHDERFSTNSTILSCRALTSLRNVGGVPHSPTPRASRGLSAFTVYLATVANRVDYECLLRVEYFVDDPEVTDSKLAESGQAAAQCLKSDCVVVRCQPVEAFDDSSPCGFVETCQVPGRRIQKANAKRHGYWRSSRRTTSSSGSPRSPRATLRFWRSSRARTELLMVSPSSGSPSNSISFCSIVSPSISRNWSFVIRVTLLMCHDT